MHMKGRTSGKNLGQNIIEILRSNEIAMADCRGQAYDGAAAMSSDRCGSEAEVRKKRPQMQHIHTVGVMSLIFQLLLHVRIEASVT